MRPRKTAVLAHAHATQAPDGPTAAAAAAAAASLLLMMMPAPAATPHHPPPLHGATPSITSNSEVQTHKNIADVLCYNRLSNCVYPVCLLQIAASNG
jgi:hypothetical protein